MQDHFYPQIVPKCANINNGHVLTTDVPTWTPSALNYLTCAYTGCPHLDTLSIELLDVPCRTTPGPGYEVGESSTAGTARQVGPTIARADLYGFADMLDAAPGRQTSRELGYGGMRSYILSWMMHDMTELYLEPESTCCTGIGHSIDRTPFYGGRSQSITCRWAPSMDACDQVRSEGISLRTTVMAQQSEITELQAADRRRQSVISDLLKHTTRTEKLVESLKIVKILKTQMIELPETC
ncbi:hypothetical protein Tco_0511338 [Tanacetum coccineum]